MHCRCLEPWSLGTSYSHPVLIYLMCELIIAERLFEWVNEESLLRGMIQTCGSLPHYMQTKRKEQGLYSEGTAILLTAD
jgi:hypothetical protein